ncbi:hypothetical protein FOCC_FOCC006052 [Frankliniella occidentalis]|nr:hypothetical protein FOCC_FOCC006052 [Frankliniella occidentalis]
MPAHLQVLDAVFSEKEEMVEEEQQQQVKCTRWRWERVKASRLTARHISMTECAGGASEDRDGRAAADNE